MQVAHYMVSAVSSHSHPGFDIVVSFCSDVDLSHLVPNSEPPKKKRKVLGFDEADADCGFDAFEIKSNPLSQSAISLPPPVQIEAEAWLRRDSIEGLKEAGITQSTVHDPGSILLFWKKWQNRYPSLAKWARLVFAIPASSAGVERMWHNAKLIVTPLIHSISPHLVRDELFISLNEKQIRLSSL